MKSEIVISGMSGRFPESENVAELSENLFNKIDMITDDDRRFEINVQDVPKRFGKIKELDKFDNLFFNVHHLQSEDLDPQGRILLEASYEAIVDAGYDPAEIAGRNIGVFIGNSISETSQLVTIDPDRFNGYALLGIVQSLFANRISHVFDFKGPSFVMDTACSSAAMALYQAFQAIKRGDCEAAIVGGAHLILKPEHTLAFSKLKMLSVDGKCKAFDAACDGYVRSEAVAVLFLQRSDVARRNYATIVSVKTNTDGYKEQDRTKSITPFSLYGLENNCKVADTKRTFVSGFIHMLLIETLFKEDWDKRKSYNTMRSFYTVFFSSVIKTWIYLATFLYFFDTVQLVLLPDPEIISKLLPFLSKQKYSPDVSTTFKEKYDYIVVGAGSAGSVVASRLSEIPCVSVLLLEAGGAPPLYSEIPVAALALWFTDVDWQFRTVPQRYTARGLVNRELQLPRGKMLGGSSSINNLLYVRGNRNDYERWESEGAKGWSYRDVLPYFKKLEDNRDPEFLVNGYHNISGPVTVERPNYTPLLKRAYYEALKGYGFEFRDPNAERQLGIYDIQGNTRDGQRCSTAKAYLVPAEYRKNLDIITNAMVKKVLIEKRRAVGVEFDYGGLTYKVRAGREVIISAGSIKTPQLLMLSGIGPEEELTKFNIPVIANLPVGKNYHDHGATLMFYQLSKKNPNVILKSVNPGSVLKYFKNRSGPLASLTYLYFLGWFKGNTTSSPIDIPNYELYLGEATASILTNPFYGLRTEVYEAILGPYALKPLLMCLVQQVRPRSRGFVTLNSTSIYDSPLINPNYLADKRDEDDMIHGMKMCDQVCLSRPMRLLGSQPLKTLIPGCEKYAFNEEKYFRCQLRTVLVSAHHSVGSVKMGDVRDPTTVIDPKLRVKSLKGLRVIDGSVMPSITSGNTNIPIIMIAEKASDMIKETIKCDLKHADYGASWTPVTKEEVKTEGPFDWIEQSSFFKSEFDNSEEKK